tara:strand:- start:3062 stop:3730 length:669 start_codon:yes stop_codon:yes gene_type:complete
MKKKNHAFYTSFLIALLLAKIVFAGEKTICLNHQQELYKIKQFATEHGGTWSIYEKLPELKAHSVEGLSLDGKITRIVEISSYLCQTLDGVPLSGLAFYVIDHLEKLGEKAFRDQLINIRGKSEKEIAVWFNYAKLALEFQKRKLSLNSVADTLGRAKEIILNYRNFIDNQTEFIFPSDIRKETQWLIKKIDVFFKIDPNMALAIHEKSQEPYWDIDEGDVG